MTGSGVVTRRAGLDLRVGYATAFGTFGELLQGVLPDDADFLVTLPIARRASASFRLERSRPLRVFPSHNRKSLTLAQTMLDSCGSPGGGTLVIDNDLPVGKGLASSSADLVATARAVGAVLGLDTTPAAIEEWLRSIEPTDGVMYPAVVAFEHRRVRLRSVLGTLPPLTIVAVDEGGQVDTVSFNQRPKPFTPADRDEYAQLLDRLAAAIAGGDLATIGQVATRSAQLNQRLQPKRSLADMINISGDVGGYGVVCAHSGTMTGILLDEAEPAFRQRLGLARSACRALPGRVWIFRSLSFADWPTGGSHAV